MQGLDYHSCRETDFNARVYIKLTTMSDHWSMKSRSRAPGHSMCLKGMCTCNVLCLQLS